MNGIRILFAGLIAGLMSGCSTTPAKNDPQAFGKTLAQIFAPFFDIVMIRSGAIDLIYCANSFRHKNERWPKDYAELSDFVQQSNGYLMLGEYERVELKQLPDDKLEVHYVPHGHTNETKFILGDLLKVR